MKVNVKPSAVITVNFEGTDYQLVKPKLGAVAELEEATEAAKASGKSITRVLLTHIVKCGLPEEVAAQLDADQLTVIVEALGAAKKN